MSALRIGHIEYLNCVPFFHYLKECGCSDEIISGVPSRLNAMLHDGLVDVSPSSSFEYALRPQHYCLLPDLSISSDGAVQSVLLFSRSNFGQAYHEPVYITGESATSVHLLQVLWLEYYGAKDFRLLRTEQDLERLALEGKTVLAIGDRAMNLSRSVAASTQIHDLGSLWKANTGLPFVFALWIARRDVAERSPEALDHLHRTVKCSLAKAQQNLPKLAERYGNAKGFLPETIADYWLKMQFALGQDHLKGVKLFFDLCTKYHFLPRSPQLSFFQFSNSDRTV